MTARASMFWLLVTSLISTPSFSADIVNGTSGNATIFKVDSRWTHVLYTLDNNIDGCGQPDRWQLDINGPNDAQFEMRKMKAAMLLTAYMGGKTVNLRCENSRVTDFEILE